MSSNAARIALPSISGVHFHDHGRGAGSGKGCMPVGGRMRGKTRDIASPMASTRRSSLGIPATSIPPSGKSQIEAHTGQAEEAIKTLRQLLTMPAGEYISVARLTIDPVWDPIRNDAGFQKLISEPEPGTIYK